MAGMETGGTTCRAAGGHRSAGGGVEAELLTLGRSPGFFNNSTKIELFCSFDNPFFKIALKCLFYFSNHYN